MKKLKLIERFSAFSIAAALTVSNVAFDYFPSGEKSDKLTAFSEENSQPEIETVIKQPDVGKSPYPSSLNFIVEKTDESYLLKVDNAEIFNRFFSAEVISEDGMEVVQKNTSDETIDTSWADIEIPEGSYTINVTAKPQDENASFISPYNLSGGEDGAANTSFEFSVGSPNASKQTAETESEEKYSFYAVKSGGGYDIVIPDDYNHLDIDEITGTEAQLSSGDEIFKIGLDKIEYDIQLLNIAQLKTAELDDPSYKAERFCGTQELPYYYGENVRIVPDAAYILTVSGNDGEEDKKYETPFIYEVGSGEISSEFVTYNFSLNGDKEEEKAGFFESLFKKEEENPNKDLFEAVAKIDGEEKTFTYGEIAKGTEITIRPKSGVLDGYKYTIEGNNQVRNNQEFVFRLNGDTDIKAEKGEAVKYIGSRNALSRLVKFDGAVSGKEISFDEDGRASFSVLNPGGYIIKEVTAAEENQKAVNLEYNNENQKYYFSNVNLHNDVSLDADLSKEVTFTIDFNENIVSSTDDSVSLKINGEDSEKTDLRQFFKKDDEEEENQAEKEESFEFEFIMSDEEARIWSFDEISIKKAGSSEIVFDETDISDKYKGYKVYPKPFTQDVYEITVTETPKTYSTKFVFRDESDKTESHAEIRFLKEYPDNWDNWQRQVDKIIEYGETVQEAEYVKTPEISYGSKVIFQIKPDKGYVLSSKEKNDWLKNFNVKFIYDNNYVYYELELKPGGFDNVFINGNKQLVIYMTKTPETVADVYKITPYKTKNNTTITDDMIQKGKDDIWYVDTSRVESYIINNNNYDICITDDSDYKFDDGFIYDVSENELKIDMYYLVSTGALYNDSKNGIRDNNAWEILKQTIIVKPDTEIGEDSGITRAEDIELAFNLSSPDNKVKNVSDVFDIILTVNEGKKQGTYQYDYEHKLFSNKEKTYPLKEFKDENVSLKFALKEPNDKWSINSLTFDDREKIENKDKNNFSVTFDAIIGKNDEADVKEHKINIELENANYNQSVNSTGSGKVGFKETPNETSETIPKNHGESVTLYAVPDVGSYVSKITKKSITKEEIVFFASENESDRNLTGLNTENGTVTLSYTVDESYEFEVEFASAQEYQGTFGVKATAADYSSDDEYLSKLVKPVTDNKEYNLNSFITGYEIYINPEKESVSCSEFGGESKAPVTTSVPIDDVSTSTTTTADGATEPTTTTEPAYKFSYNEKPESQKRIFYISYTDGTMEEIEVTLNKVTTTPEITTFKVEKQLSIVRLLTFGIFGKDSIKVTVTAKETEETGFDITGITLYDGDIPLDSNGGYIDKNNWTKANNGDIPITVDSKGVYTFSYNQPVDAKKIYNLTARASVTLSDGVYFAGGLYNFGVTKNVELTENKSYEVVDAALSSDSTLLVLEKDKPEISKIIPGVVKENDNFTAFDFSNGNTRFNVNNFYAYKDSNGKIWTNGDFSYEINASDSDSGLNNISYGIYDNDEKNPVSDGIVTFENASGTTPATTWVVPVEIPETNTVVAKKIVVNAEDNSGNKNVDNHENNEKTVWVDKKAPVFDDLTLEIVDAQENKLNDYTQGKWTNGCVKVTLIATDEGSGIKLELDGIDITKNKEYAKDLRHDKTNDGKDVFTFTVKPDFSGDIDFTVYDNVNNATQGSVNVRTEDDAPIVNGMVIDIVSNRTNGRWKNNSSDVGQDDLKGFSRQDYGYYFEQNAIITVKATDYFGGITSGVERIEFAQVSVSQMDSNYNFVINTISDFHEFNDNEKSHEWDFIVKAGFKGQIVARAIDAAGNVGEWQTPDGVILETQDQHNENSSIRFVRDAAPYSDRNGVDLYNEAAKVNIVVADPWSGIKTINYIVRSTETDEVIEEGDFDFVANKTDGWELTTERNIVTIAEKELSISAQENNIQIEATFTDNAGYTTDWQYDHLSIDSTPPQIVSFTFNDNAPDDQKFFRAARTATIVVNERNLNTANTSELIEATLKNQLGTVSSPYSISSWTSGALSNADVEGKNEWTVKITFDANAEYTFSMGVTDLAENETKTAEKSFTIDTVLPKIDVSFDNNKSSNAVYYNSNRKALLTINEHNFVDDGVRLYLAAFGDDNVTPVESSKFVSGVEWKQSETNPDEWTANIDFNQDGRYSFTLDCTDAAGNNGNEFTSNTFYIDKVAPKVEQTFTSGSREKIATKGALIPTVSFTDYNLHAEKDVADFCTVKIEKVDVNGPSDKKFSSTSHSYTAAGQDLEAVYEAVFDIFNNDIETDGIYDISISATDLAGNTSAVISRTVSINRYGSTYEIVNDSAKNAVARHKENIPVNADIDVIIREVNVTEIESNSSVTVILDNNILSDCDYSVEESRTAEDESGWYELVYNINKSNFSNDGNYLINIETNDAAGNRNSNNTPVYEARKCAVEFSIDRTVPEVIISGVEDNAVLKEAEVQLRITCSDRNLYKAGDIQGDNLVMTINNKDYSADDIRSLGAKITNDESENIIISLPVKADGKNSKQDIKVAIKDRAGNISDADASGIRFELLASFFARHGLLSALMILAALVLIIGISTTMARKSRRH